jgi:outer membrane protein assembly factor BamB
VVRRGNRLHALDPASGETVRTLDVAGHAGTAFDGRHLYQLAEDRASTPSTPRRAKILRSIPAPGGGGDSGLTWAEGTLWVGQYRDRKIHQIDPETGAILRTLESNRFVTGVTWVDGELWHGTWEGDESDLRRLDAQTGEVLERLEMPPGTGVSGLESDGETASTAVAAAAAPCGPCAARASRPPQPWLPLPPLAPPRPRPHPSSSSSTGALKARRPVPGARGQGLFQGRQAGRDG